MFLDRVLKLHEEESVLTVVSIDSTTSHHHFPVNIDMNEVTKHMRSSPIQFALVADNAKEEIKAQYHEDNKIVL